MKTIAKLALVAAALCMVLVAGAALAMDKMEADLKVQEATINVKQFMQSPDAGTPRWLLQRCKAIAIFPNMVKAGFVIGGKYGTGVVLVKKADGTWTPPAFFLMGGLNVGFQIGAEAVDLFMVIMTDKGLQGILKNQVKFGVDASVAAGPVGRTADASLSGASFSADIYSYSRSQGAFAGATVGGAGIEFDAKSSQAYYGQALSVTDILDKGMPAAPPASAVELDKALKDLNKMPAAGK